MNFCRQLPRMVFVRLAAAISAAAFLFSGNGNAQPVPIVLTNDTGMSSSQIWVQFMGGSQVDGYYSNVFGSNQTLFANTAYSLDQLTNPLTGKAEVFINEFSAGRIYVNFGPYGLSNLGANGGFYTPAAANPLDPNYNTRYQYFEQTILPQPTGGSTVWADLSYIDFTAISLSMYAKYSANGTLNPHVGNGNQTSVNTQQLVNATVGSAMNATLAVLPSGASSTLPNNEFTRVISPQFSANGTYHDFTAYLGHLGNSTTQVKLDGTFVGTGPQPAGNSSTQAQTYNFVGNFTNSPLAIPGYNATFTNGGIVLSSQSNSGNSSVSWLPASYNPGGAFPGIGSNVTIYITNDDLNSQEGIYGNNMGYYISIDGGNATRVTSLQNDVYGRVVGDLLAGLSFGYVGSNVTYTTPDGQTLTIGQLSSSQWWAGGAGAGDYTTLADGTVVTWDQTPASQQIWFSGAQPGNPLFYNGYAGSIADLTPAYGFPLQDRLGTNLLVYNTAASGTTDTFLEVVVNPDGSAPLPTAIWTGNGTDMQWGTAANWNGNATAGGTSVQFVGNHTQTYVVNTGSNRTVSGIAFNFAAGNFTIANNTITLGGGIVNSSNKTQTINSDLVLSSNSTVVAAFGDLVLGGDVSLSNNATARTMHFTGTQNSTVSGIISDGVAPGGSVTKSGNGTLTLSSSNSFTGNFVHSGGTVVAAADDALGAGGLVMQGGTLVASGGNRTFNNPTVSLAGTNHFQGSNSMLFTGGLVFGDQTVFSNSADVAFTGGISGAANGTASKSGTGTLTFGGSTPIAYTGALNINEGALVLANTSGSSFNGTLGVGDGLGAGGSAIVRLAAGNQTSTATTLNLHRDGIFDLQSFSTAVGNTTISGGTITGTGLLTFANNSTVIFNGTGNSTAQIDTDVVFEGGLGTFAVNYNDAPVQLTLTGDLTGSGNLTKSGSGTMQITGNSSYSGNLFIGGGVLASSNIADADVILTNGALSPGGLGSIESITLGNLTSVTSNTTAGAFVYDLGAGSTADHITARTVSLGNSTIFLFSSSTFSSGSANFTLVTGTDSLTANLGTFQFASLDIAGLTGTFSTVGNTLHFNAIAGVNATWTGNSSATWTDAGNWGSNSAPVTGADIILAGSTNTSISGAAGQTGAILFAPGAGVFTIAGAGLTLGGDVSNNSTNTQTINTNLALNASRTISANTGNLVLGGEIVLSTNGALANSLTFHSAANQTISATGAISNGVSTAAQGGGILKTGDGTLSLSGDNSNFTGAVSILGGVLEANSSNALGNGTIATNTLAFDNGTLRATGDILSGPALGINRAIFLLGNGTFDTNGNTILTGGPISGAGALIKTGAGSLVLVEGSMLNSYSGGTFIRGGTLEMRESTVLGAPGSAVSVESGSLTMNGSFTVEGHSLTLNGTGDGGEGALRLIGGAGVDNVAAWNGTIALAGNATARAESQQTLKLSGPSISLGSNTFELSAADGGTIALSSQLIGSGGITKTGNGTLNVSSQSSLPNSTYNGTTTVAAGILNYQGAGALGGGNSSMVVQSGGTLQLGTLPPTGIPSQTAQYGVALPFAFSNVTLTGAGFFASGQNEGALNVNAFGNVTLTGNVSLGGDTLIRGTEGALTISGPVYLGNSTLTIINRTAMMTFSGAISGNGGITMNGTSQNGLLLAGNNSYNGTTSIEGDTFVLAGSNNALGSTVGATTVQSTGALWLQGGITSNEAVTITGTGFTATGALRNISGNNTLGGNITLAGATQINSANGTLHFANDFNANQTLTLLTETSASGIVFNGNFTATSATTFQGNGTTTISGSLGGGAALTIEGGTLILENAATYSAAFQLGNATLAVGNATSAPLTALGPASTISPGAVGTAAEAAFGSITATSGARFLMDLGANATLSDSVRSVNGPNMSGNLGFVFTDIGISNNTTYTLISSVNGNGGTLSIGDMSFTSNNTQLGGTFSVNNAGPFSVAFTTRLGGVEWNSGNGSWGDGALWEGGFAPASGSAVVFTGSSNATVDTGANRYTGQILFAPGAGSYNLSNNTIQTYGGIVNNSGVLQTVSSGIELAGSVPVDAASGDLLLGGPISFGETTGRTLTFTGNHNTTVSGAISTANGTVGNLVKSGNGTLILSGNSTFAGTTQINAGTLLVNGSLGANSTVTVGSGGTLGGDGSVGGAVAVHGTLSPGNSPGNLATGSQSWFDDGDYNWQVYDVDGVAGTAYDTITITGQLDLTNLTTGNFSINLWTLSAIAPDVNGDALDFNPANSYSWTIVSTTLGITGFSAADFTVHHAANNGAAGFSNAFDGTFAVAVSGNNLLLTYTPIPEPSSLLLVAFGIGAFALRRRFSTRK